jgi:hypothetical protein
VVPLLDLVRTHEFVVGLEVGSVAAVAVGSAGLVWRYRAPLPIAGTSTALAVIVGFTFSKSTSNYRGALPVGLAVLAAAGMLYGSRRTTRLLALLISAAGAALVAGATEGKSWVVAFVFVTVILCAPLVADFDRFYVHTGLGTVLIAMVAAGVYATVPDTEQARLLLGATLPVTLVAWPRPLVSLGGGGSFAVVGLIAWVSAVGGQGRPSSILAGVACLGVIIAEPLVRHASGRRLRASGPLCPAVLLIVAIELGVIALCSRVAGHQSGVGPVAAIVASAFVATVMALWAISRWERGPAGAEPASRNGVPATRRRADP